MTEITLGDRRYTIRLVESAGQWTAYAERADTGARFGAGWTGASEAEAVDRLSRWLTWQHEHEAALAALQDAEKAYHRSIAGTAFTSAAEGEIGELQRDALAAVEAARQRLDEVRAQQPG